MSGSHHDDDNTASGAAPASGQDRNGPPANPQPRPEREIEKPEEGTDSGRGQTPGQQHDGAASSNNSVHSHSDSDHDHREDGDAVSRVLTHVSLGPENVAGEAEQWSSNVEIPDEVYDRFTPSRKTLIVTVVSFASFLSPVSSTTVLSAVPEVAAEYSTTGTIVNLSNAMYMLFLGVSPLVWGPLCQVYGRRPVNLATAILFFGCSIGTALAPNLASFFVFRILSAFEGTSFILVGSACVSDIYRPTERATAMGWFLSGTLIGPALGPFIGGIIVTFRSWRVIFWLQSALAGAAALLVFFLQPETAHRRKIDELVGLSGRRKARVMWSMTNPVRVIKLWRYPNLTLTGLASSALLWNMYSLLTPIRYVLNPRFNLTTPMQSGLFYLAPGCGYLMGTLVGGRFADYTVRRWIKKRDGVRVPEDRLRSAVFFMGVAIPGCTLAYGWGVEKNAGGIPLAVIMLFLQGVAQLFCFPSLNTYCLDVMQSQAAEVIAGNYVMRFLFACAGTAAVLPAVQTIGVGWFSTISSLLLIAATLGVMASVRWGKGWRDDIDQARRAERAKRRMARREAEGGEAGGVKAEESGEGRESQPGNPNPDRV